MDIRQALKEQFHAGLRSLAQCVERCPDDLWAKGEPPRTFWQVAFHAAFFTQFYLGQDESAVRPWPGHRADLAGPLSDPMRVEPYELAPETEPCDKATMLGYIAHVDSLVDPTLDGLDLDAETSGFRNYPTMAKPSHEMMTLRHLFEHIGQFGERLMAQGIDIDWISRADAWP